MGFTTHLNTGGNPNGVLQNHSIQMKWEENNRTKWHAKHLSQIKPSVDNAQPQTMLLGHLTNNKKKVFVEEQRMAKIEEENNVLLKKLSQIANPVSKKSKAGRPAAKLRGQSSSMVSLNGVARRREEERIANENARMIKRLQLQASAPSSKELDRRRLQAEFEKNLVYRQLASNK